MKTQWTEQTTTSLHVYYETYFTFERATPAFSHKHTLQSIFYTKTSYKQVILKIKINNVTTAEDTTE